MKNSLFLIIGLITVIVFSIPQAFADHVPPSVNIDHDTTVVWAENANGAIVNYVVWGGDGHGNDILIPTCDIQSGTLFPTGETRVTCSVTTSGGSSSADFAINVLTNEIPTAVDDFFELVAEIMLIDVISNDTDPDDDFLWLNGVDPNQEHVSKKDTKYGTIEMVPGFPHTLKYTLTDSEVFCKDDSFGYLVTDGAPIESAIHTTTANQTGTIIIKIKENPLDDSVSLNNSIYWTGEGDGSNWSDEKNWCPERVPTEMDSVFLSKPGLQYNVNLDMAFSIVTGGLTINPGNTLKIDSTKILTNSKTITNNGFIDILGTLEITGTGNLINNDTIENSGTLSNSNKLINSGTISNAGKFETWRTFENNGIFENKWDFESSGDVINSDQISNSHIMKVKDTLKNLSDATIINSKIIELNSVKIDNSGIIDNQDDLKLWSGEINNSKIIKNSGTLENKNTGIINNLENAEIENTGIVKNENEFFNSGKLTNSKEFINTNMFEIQKNAEVIIEENSTFSNTNKVTVKEDGSLKISGEFDNSDELKNYGVIEINENGDLITDGDFETFKELKIDDGGRFENKNTFTIVTEAKVENKGKIKNSGNWYMGHYQNDHPPASGAAYFYNLEGGEMLNTPTGFIEVQDGHFQNTGNDGALGILIKTLFDVTISSDHLPYDGFLENQGRILVKEYFDNSSVLINSGVIDIEGSFTNENSRFENYGTLNIGTDTSSGAMALKSQSLLSKSTVIPVFYNEGLVKITESSRMDGFFRFYNQPQGTINLVDSPAQIGFNKELTGNYNPDIYTGTELFNDGCIHFEVGTRIADPERGHVIILGEIYNISEFLPNTSEYKDQYVHDKYLKIEKVTNIGDCSTMSSPPLLSGEPPPRSDGKEYLVEIIYLDDYLDNPLTLDVVYTDTVPPETTQVTPKTTEVTPKTTEETTLDNSLAGNILESKKLAEEPKEIPKWIKNNAAWYGEKKISDKDFATGIGFMIKEEIIKVDTIKIDKDSDLKISDDIQIPDWVQNNAKWWADGLIADQDFKAGIAFMVKEKIIDLSSNETAEPELVSAPKMPTIKSHLNDGLFNSIISDDAIQYKEKTIESLVTIATINQVSSQIQLEIRNYLEDYLNDELDRAWDKHVEENTSQSQNYAVSVQKMKQQNKIDSQKWLSTTNTSKQTRDSLLNSAQTAGFDKFTLDKTSTEEFEKYGDKIKTESDLKNAIKDLKSLKSNFGKLVSQLNFELNVGDYGSTSDAATVWCDPSQLDAHDSALVSGVCAEIPST